MQKVFCSLEERFVNPLFEVFDGGDFVLSSYRDVERPLTEIQIYFPEAERIDEAKARLSSALGIIGCEEARVSSCEIADEDWKFSYRRHFKTERIGKRLVVHPAWEPMPAEGVVVTLDPGLAFGTGKHETTRACLEYIDEIAYASGAAKPLSFLDMGCGSGILSIAAAKLGCAPSVGFDVDMEAVAASRENAAANGVDVKYLHFALGPLGEDAPQYDVLEEKKYDLVVANILGPLLIKFAPQIERYAGRHLVISGILSTLYGEVLSAYTALGFKEVSRKTLGEWTTGLLAR